ncbi:TRAP transporter substrate-binding protein [Enterocloster asparagiformis]|uniref:TRAP transporter substrate-binding protein n=1 Tax=Enterocloster asparagiformis TaxID=333367 RepID=UPI000463976E|nr:TRAP transporter substrate-binding protein [Enterocloster asparagiformis]
MKKQIALATAAAMVLGLAACGSKPAETKPAETAAQAKTEAVTEAEEKETEPKETEGSAAAITFKLADNQADGTPNVSGDTKFAELVNEYTGGTVVVEIFPNGTLGDEASVADMLEADTLDIARISTNGISPSCDAFNVFGMPYVFPSDEIKYKALDGEFGQTLTAKLEEETGLINLAYFVSGPRSFYTTKKEIHSVADMAGLKLRAQDDAITIAMMEALGASATPMNYAEVYSALETGVVDGAENDFTSYYSSGHYEVAKYYSLDMHTAPSSLLVMSAGAWNSLSAEQQEQVRKAAAEAETYQRTLVEDYIAESRQKVEEGGATIIEVDVAEFQNACQPVYDKFPQYNDLIALIPAE